MKLTLAHAQYVSNKISLDLLHLDNVKLTRGVEEVAKISYDLLEENIKKEIALEQRVNEILEENNDEIEFNQVDEKQLFWMIKRKIASEFDVILNLTERYSDLSHKIADELIGEETLEFSVSEHAIKNSIQNSIEGYLDEYANIQDIVLDRISNYKRTLIPGTEDYEILFERLYEEELKKKGFI